MYALTWRGKAATDDLFRRRASAPFEVGRKSRLDGSAVCKAPIDGDFWRIFCGGIDAIYIMYYGGVIE